ncbi:RNA polymerase sigma factor [Ichthyenterobacterium magnum]|uniref:RNA polymerase sigma-70 factor (ECF subfamily) n=1 Tax=Ichthyenterobacterium magnum TaxID=1230530 RepID=A0A420DKM4_9FLAO|nr:RNA polymerase sigma factor [Ichthyenterobacterium magnum]RKE94748.1 RNA polymerase sigma-70 factor (ECF subfamily) [Ichthyenterobacterium magnum]
MLKTNKSIDANLVKQFQSGNANALNQLVKRWHKQFCEKAYWIVKDADQSKDIAQETWKTIITKIQDLKEPNKFSSWALQIVYSKSLDVIRASSKKRIKLEAFARERPEDIYEDNDNSQLKNELLKSIKKLPINQQQVIKLFYVADYSLKEISELLDVSIGTVKSRLFHAREKLKTILKKE